MNIFVTHKSPKKSAKFLDNKRVNKMILETAQLISTSIKLNNITINNVDLYKITHKNHPCSIWAREDLNNLMWLLEYFKELSHVRNTRFTTKHATIDKFYSVFNNLYDELKKQGYSTSKHTPFANCARRSDINVDFTNESDVHKAYRLYLRVRWGLDKIQPKHTRKS